MLKMTWSGDVYSNLLRTHLRLKNRSVQQFDLLIYLKVTIASRSNKKSKISIN